MPMAMDGEANLSILRIRIRQHSIRNFDLSQIVPITENVADQVANLDLEPLVALISVLWKSNVIALLID